MHASWEKPNLERTMFTRTRPLVLGACIALYLAGAVASLDAQDVALENLPPALKRPVDFLRDVQPILAENCLRCHGPTTAKSRFRLDNRADALKGGENFPDAIVPGDSARSRLIHFVAGADPEITMPPPEKGEPLTAEEIGVLRAWIDQGANWPTNGGATVSLTLAPGLRWVSVDGNRAKFREVEGITDGWAGGVERFELRDSLGPDTSVTAEGHALFGDESYQLKLALDKRDVGFIHAGVETWREFYDDRGGYAPLLLTNSFALNRDLHLDVGRVWIDFGLLKPDVPEVVLGYEYQFREGNKSTLQWGPVGTLPPFDPATDAKNVYPAFKEISEHAHILKLDVRHELRGWELEDNARVEFYSLATRRENVLQHTLGATPDSISVVREKHEHVSGANTFTVTKQLREWMTVSSGWLYSRLDANGSLEQSTRDGSGGFAFGDQWTANRITMKRESQVVSLASILGPWDGLTISLGGQGEWTRQESIGQEDLRIGNPGVPLLFSDASPVTGNLDTRSARENVLLRFGTIPFTVVTAELRAQQESLARFEERPEGNDPFRRDTDADIVTEEYRIGFNSSPWPRLSFGASYKRRDKQTDYNHIEVFHPAGYLYPGFILWRDIHDDQVDARVVYRLTRWLRASLNYQWRESDFNSATAPVPGVSPGGAIEAANFGAHSYSVNLSATPTARLFLSGTLAYSDSRTRTAQNGADYLAPWRGDIYSVLGSGTFALAAETSLRASYAFTRSDFGQGNSQTGLPAGIEFDRHAVQFAVSHRFAQRVTTNLGYGFFRYREPNFSGANDYTAHAVFASASFPWP